MKLSLSIIVFISLTNLIVLNEYNLSFLKPDFPYKQGLITTADEPSYFAPAINFIEHGVWKDNSSGNSSYFTRTPAYGLIFIVANCCGKLNAFFLLKIIQILFFCGSLILFFKLLLFFRINRKTALLVTLLYGILPCFSGFVYYTLSESIIPFFLLWAVYSTLKMNPKVIFSWEVIASNAFMVMIRPQLIVIPVIFLLVQLFNREKRVISLIIAFIPLILWNIRSYSIEGNWLGIHPIYSPTNKSIFRPPHEEMTNLFRIWDFRGDVFHTQIHTLSRDTSKLTLNKVLQQIPSRFRIDAAPLFVAFQRVSFHQQHLFNNKEIKCLLPIEKEFMVQCASTRKRLIKQFPFDYYVKTPLMSAKKLIVTSMMNLYVFQVPWRSFWVVKALKLFSFFIIFGGFCTLFIQLFHHSKELRILSFSLLLSFFYLVVVQRFNEERYILPYLSLMLIQLTILFQRCYTHFKNKLAH